MNPVLLPPDPVQHVYKGGDRIARLRGVLPRSDHQPEEWLGSTVTRFGETTTGLSVTSEGARLRDLVVADRIGWIGSRRGSDEGDVGILVKLLDAGERLPVHVHPTRAFAHEHLACPYGKTEAWYVLDAEPGADFYLGWKQDVDRDELDRRRDAQDGEWFLDHMNRVPARPGRGVLVPAGTVHAIDDGIFVAEVQEPTDFSIVLEWAVTALGREESHLNLGFDTAMPAVSTRAIDARELSDLVTDHDPALRGRAVTSVLPPRADPYFRLLRVSPSDSRSDAVPPGFAVVLVLEGEGDVVGATGRVTVQAGQAYAVPHGFGPWHVVGAVTVIAGTPGAQWPASLADGRVR